MKETRIKIFETGIKDGIFSENPKFYEPNTSKNERREHFCKVKNGIGEKYGFEGCRIIQALQKNEINGIEYEDGKSLFISELDLSKEDLWDVEAKCDILILSENDKNVVLGNQMADCPILIIEDREKGFTALSHCGASYINRDLPKETALSLINKCGSKVEDLYVYIGSSSKKENYIYDRYPQWATNTELWSDCIEEKEDGFHIDMNKAIIKQLKELNIQNIYESPIDTIKSTEYYSHRAYMLGNKEKFGQNFVGFYYK